MNLYAYPYSCLQPLDDHVDFDAENTEVCGDNYIVTFDDGIEQSVKHVTPRTRGAEYWGFEKNWFKENLFSNSYFKNIF